MERKDKYKRLICWILLFTLVYAGMAIRPALGTTDAAVSERLEAIGEREQEVLSTLFTLLQEQEELALEEARLDLEIGELDQSILKLEAEIQAEELVFEAGRERLGAVLLTYQRRGAGSYLEAVLGADSLSDLIRRVNLLRDLTRNTGQLLEAVEESQQRLVREQQRVTENRQQLVARQEQLQQAQQARQLLIEEQEAYLASLQEEREYYQNQLAYLEQEWAQLKPFLKETVASFARLVRVENLPEDGVELSTSFLSVRGRIREATFNEIVQSSDELPHIQFTFTPEQVVMEMPEKRLVLAGNFTVGANNMIYFKVASGSFYGLPLLEDSLLELFGDGDMSLDLKPLIGNNRLRTITSHEGYIELMVNLSLF